MELWECTLWAIWGFWDCGNLPLAIKYNKLRYKAIISL